MTETQHLFPEILPLDKKEIIIKNPKLAKITNVQKKRKKIKSLFLDIFCFILIIIAIYLYYYTLRNVCEGTQAQCLSELNSTIFYVLGIQMIISVLILEIIILLILNRIIHFYHLIYIIPLFAYFVHFYDTGSDLHHHGSYNKIVFYFLIFAIGIILGILYLFYYLFKNRYNKTIFILLVTFLLIFLLLRHKLYFGCTKWLYGLNGIKIENDPSRDKCYFIHPNKCWINLQDGLFDVSRILGETCDNFRKDEKSELYKYLSSDLQNSSNIGYPITINFDWEYESLYKIFYKKVMARMVNLEKYNNSKDNNNFNILEPEVSVKFDKETELGHIEINIKRNEKIVKERQNIFNNLTKEESPRYKNVLFLFIDSLSRPQFVRKMKKTQKFLEQFYDNNNLYDFYQMMKFHSLLFFTMPNVNPMFYGRSMYTKTGTNLLRAFKEKGFITAQSNNICGRELYDLEKGYNLRLNYENFDHENIAMFCDPNYFKNESPYTAFIGPYALKRRCLYGRDTFEYIFEYSEKFWQAYKEEPKFLRLAFQEAHEGTEEVVTLLDKALSNFLENFQQKGYLDNTAIIFVSDHGNNMFGFNEIFKFEDYMIEKSLPTWLMLLPKSNNNTEIEIIKENQQKFVTAYDIHETLLDILNIGENSHYRSQKGKSIFKNINAEIRNCEYYGMEIGTNWCRCYKYK